MQIKMTPRIRELVDILSHYEKEHGEIDENAPKEVLDAYKELMDLDCWKALTKQLLSKNSESAFYNIFVYPSLFMFPLENIILNVSV